MASVVGGRRSVAGELK